jgi:hypothetical protein
MEAFSFLKLDQTRLKVMSLADQSDDEVAERPPG